MSLSELDLTDHARGGFHLKEFFSQLVSRKIVEITRRYRLDKIGRKKKEFPASSVSVRQRSLGLPAYASKLNLEAVQYHLIRLPKGIH